MNPYRVVNPRTIPTRLRQMVHAATAILYQRVQESKPEQAWFLREKQFDIEPYLYYLPNRESDRR